MSPTAELHIYLLTHVSSEPELFRGYDPKRKGFTQEVEIQHDLEPIETNPADADKFRLEHGNKVDIWTDGDRCFIKFKKGAKLLVPKAIRFDRLVAGQIPTGWDARVFGIPDDIVSQVDRTALWALVCVAEALMASGITDPYELYKYVHPSEVGTAIGSGMGGMESLSKMFRDRREEKDIQNDILQETFINTVAGWVNLLLVSSSGPVKIPVGACATALQSVEIACDTILSGKAKVMFAGGYDDFSEEGSYEFANMKATSNTETEFASGREPNEMSRPTTSTRAGFMESQGCGVQVLMSAKTALDMGATICMYRNVTFFVDILTLSSRWCRRLHLHRHRQGRTIYSCSGTRYSIYCSTAAFQVPGSQPRCRLSKEADRVPLQADFRMARQRSRPAQGRDHPGRRRILR